jgi:PAS domain S-box-containing protein
VRRFYKLECAQTPRSALPLSGYVTPLSLEHPVQPLAAIAPATSRWIREAERRHTITLFVCVLVIAAVNAAGAHVDWRTYVVMGAWIGINLVVAPWAARPHDFTTRLRRYGMTVVMDVLFLGGVYLFLDAAQWVGAVFFIHSAIVAAATLPRRWAFGIAALIVVVYSSLVIVAVTGGSVVASPLGLPSVRGNYVYATASIGAAVVLIGILMLLEARLVDTIRDTEQRYLLLVQSAPDMVITFDEAGQFDDVNPATVEQSGYTWQELKALPNTSLFPPEEWPKIMAARERNMAGETVSMDVRYRRKNGDVRWIQARSTPFRRAGDRSAVLVIARDVTEAKRQTDELRARDERFRHIVNSLDVGFYTIDRSQRHTALLGRWAEANPEGAASYIGRTAREILGPEVGALHEAANARVLAGEDLNFQWSMMSADGTAERILRTHLSPIRDAQGQVVGAAGVYTNETASVHAERERDALKERVASAERIESLGKLVSGVAHELNNPLAAILNFTEDLLADTRPDEERMALEVIQSQALRSRTIVRDLLTYVRKGDRRQRQLETPGPILETLVRVARPGLATQGVAFDASVSDPDTSLLLDRAGFEQVVTNLITNAAQAAGGGGAVRLLARRDGDSYVVVVEDNGAGIREEHLARIFEPFFTTKPTGQGVGLGLSVSLSIVRGHEGTLLAENRSARSGGGARFIMRLPVANRADEPVAAATTGPAAAVTATGKTRAAAGAEAIDEGPSSPMPSRLPSLLVIDDEVTIRRALRRHFERRGWAVDEAPDGTDALVKLLRRDASVLYDVVLCDLKMPGIAGPELYRRLEAESPDMVRRLILSTGDVSAADVVAFLAGVTVPVLEKPFELSTLENLAEKVRRETGEDRRGRGPAKSPA